jgi:hypothetical protein
MRFVRKLETDKSGSCCSKGLVSYVSSWSSLYIKGPWESSNEINKVLNKADHSPGIQERPHVDESDLALFRSSNPYPSQYLIIWHHIATVPSAVHLLQISTIVVSPVSLEFKLHLSESQMTAIVRTLGHAYMLI